jgi:hypothetical protein
MRISTNERDVGFSPEAKNATVTLDDAEVTGFTTADDEAGFVRVGDQVHRGKITIVARGGEARQSLKTSKAR